MERDKKSRILWVFRSRYHEGSRKVKIAVITEVCGLLGVSRRHGRRLLVEKRQGRPRKSHRCGRPKQYGDPSFTKELRWLWRTSHYMCSRHLKAAIPEWIPHVEAEKGAYEVGVKERLAKVSAATIDRILKPWKANKGKSLTRSGGFREQIPIQENVWDIEMPGYLEADTVAHCGGSTRGEYINTLTMVDIATTWVETRAVFGKGSTPIVYAIEDIERQLPFELKGYDSDNGTEVLNAHILRYFIGEREERGLPPVQVTRSREYRKNDNAHVEQKNNSVARRWLGYERLDHRELTPLVNYYFRDVVCPLINHYYPTFKLVDKIRVKSQTRRIYRDPVTPYARVMASPYVKDEIKQRLQKVHGSLNPLDLLRQEAAVRTKIDRLLKALRQGDPPKGLLDVPTLRPCFSPSPFALQTPTPPQCSPPPFPEGLR